MDSPQRRVNALTYMHPGPLLCHQGEVEIFPKPLSAKGNRRRLGLLCRSLAVVFGVPPAPTHVCSPTPMPPARQVGVWHP